MSDRYMRCAEDICKRIPDCDQDDRDGVLDDLHRAFPEPQGERLSDDTIRRIESCQTDSGREDIFIELRRARASESALLARLREAERLLDAIQTDCDDIGKAASDAIDAYFARVRQAGA